MVAVVANAAESPLFATDVKSQKQNNHAIVGCLVHIMWYIYGFHYSPGAKINTYSL